MKIHQLQHGEPFTLTLLSEGGGPFAEAPAQNEEVRLVFPSGTDLTVLSWQGHSAQVLGADDVSRRRLRLLRQQEPPRLCWLLRHETERLILSVHRFRSHIRWDQELSLAVDERVVERVSARARRRLDVEAACAWLAEQVLLPEADGLPRLVATGAPDRGGRFRLLGRGVGVDVQPDDALLRVDAVVPLRTRRGFRPPEFLVQARLQFADATAAGQVRQSVRGQLQAMVAEADTSYLQLWQRYQEIERGQILSRARALGWLRFESQQPRPDGLWCFTVRSKEKLRAFVDRLYAEDQELEAAKDLPAELVDAEADAAPADRGQQCPFVGLLQRVDWGRKQLFLRPLDEERDFVVPRKGYLFAALQGDRTRLQRREDALRRLLAADARLPQLALIIEGRPAPMRRSDRVKALTSAARAHFAHEPTSAQRDALDRALNTPDIALIQGPPGTGKTTVIAALEARLSEIEADTPDVAGRTLLTSFQHAAVDNAVERSSVFGLPPARFGGARGSRAVTDQADRHAQEMREHLQAQLAALDDERPRALYRAFRDRVAAHAARQPSEEEERQLLDDLIALPAGELSTPLWERLRTLRQRRTSSGAATSLDQALDLKAARGILVTAVSFEDGGPVRAQRALRQLGERLSKPERALLQRAADIPLGVTFAELEALAALREALIDRLTDQPVPGEGRRRDPRMTEALNQAVAELYARMEQSPDGVADALQELAETLQGEPGEAIRTLRHYSAVYAASCQQAVGRPVLLAKVVEGTLQFENVLVDEAARANPLDLFIPISLAGRRVILVGDHRQLAHMLEPDVERELDEGVDEAMRRALKQSLFERLFADLKRREQEDGVIRVVTLDQQFRMHPVVGQFVSDVFYAPYDEAFTSPRPAEDFTHRLPTWSRGGRPLCAAWKDLPYVHGGERRDGTSWQRPEEAHWIARQVHELLTGPGHDLTVGVISFYASQVQAILQAMQSPGLTERDADSDLLDIAPDWRTLERADGRRVERLRVGTVDAFQGMEFDVVFLSVVRSNTVQAEDPRGLRRKYGHLLLENRLCVAMSRQVRLLVAVGDAAMFEDEAAQHALPGLARFLDLCGGEHGLVC